MMFLLSFHGTIVCVDPSGTLVHRPMLSEEGQLQRLSVDIEDATPNQRLEAMLCQKDDRSTNARLTLQGVDYEVRLLGGGRLATISSGPIFCSAIPGVDSLALDRGVAEGWETFLCLSADEVSQLVFLLSSDWVCASSGTVARAQSSSLRESYSLVIGPHEVDLRYNTPLLPNGALLPSSTNHHFSYILLIDGWRIERIYFYRPMTYFTAFRSPAVLQQVVTAMQSLLEFGAYDGHFHLITDQPTDFFLREIPSLSADRISVQTLAPEDWVGFVAAKYAIVSERHLFGYQPVLFLDTDVVCDAPIEPMLAAIAAAKAMTAQIEDLTWLQYNPSVGASLIQRAQLDPRFARGFNGGTIGIPNLPQYAPLLNVVSTVIINQAQASGRHQFRWVDQEVVNYVSYCLAHFDTHTLAKYVRFGWKDDEFDATRRLGLVHFWPGIEGLPKENRMQNYVATLRDSAVTRTAS